MADKPASTSKAPDKATTGGKQQVVRPGEEFILDAVDTLGAIQDSEGLDEGTNMFPQRERPSPLAFDGFGKARPIDQAFSFGWDPSVRRKTVKNRRFPWKDGEQEVPAANVVSEFPRDGVIYLLGVRDGETWTFYIEGEDGEHYPKSTVRRRIYEFEHGYVKTDYRWSFLPPVDFTDQTTFRLRAVKGEGESYKAQVYIHDPTTAVTWNTTPLTAKSGDGTLKAGWNDIGECGDFGTVYFLTVKVVVKFDEVRKKYNITERINGIDSTVEREYVTHEYKEVEGEYKISRSSEEEKNEPLAKDVADSGGGGTPTFASPFVRRVLRASEGGAGDGTRTPMEAEITYGLTLGRVAKDGSVNNILGAIHYVNILGWEEHTPDGVESGSGPGSSGSSGGPGSSGSSSEPGGSGGGGSGGSGGGGSGESGSGESGESGESGHSGETGPSHKLVRYIGDIKYECPNFMKRVDTYDPVTHAVQEGEWEVMVGGTCTPLSLEG